ncbi:hypothetical protein PHYC_03835 [Phycisphaerales bacterium]|nr:hypothetical protein PHYC_03835 [Phycisphaerales bacterium]
MRPAIRTASSVGNLLLVAAIALLLPACNGGPSGSRLSSASVSDPPSAGCAALAKVMLYQIGVTPGSLAAIGASDDQVRSIAGAARALCEIGSPSMADLHRACADGAAHVQALSDKARSGQATVADRQALAAARASLAADREECESRLDSLWTTIEGVLDDDQVRTLGNIVRAPACAEAPVAFKVIPRSEEAWMELRDRLGECRARGEDGSSLAEADVATAQFCHDDRIGLIALEWNDALGQ